MRRKRIVFLMIIVMFINLTNIASLGGTKVYSATQNEVYWMEYFKSESTGIPTIASDGLTVSLEKDTYAATNIGKTGGKWYWEVEVGENLYGKIGFLTEDDITKNYHYAYKPYNRHHVSYMHTYQRIGYRGSDPYAKTGDIVRFMVDADKRTMKMYLNTFQIHETDIVNGLIIPAIITESGSDNRINVKANFGSEEFKFEVPEGYLPYTNQSAYDVDLSSENGFATIMEAGEKLQLSLSSQLFFNSHYNWTSDNTSVARVDETGLVTALSPGKAEIKAVRKDGSKNFTMNIYVRAIAVEDIKITLETGAMAINEKISLVAEITPNNAANKNIIWSSNDESIATVDAFGEVTGIAEGTAVITAKTEDGNHTDQCEINVIYRAPVNLALNATAESNSVSSSSYKAEKALDGDLETRWLAKSNVTDVYLELTLPEETTFNNVVIHEFGNRIGEYSIQVWKDEWVDVYTGNQIEENNSLDFETVTASKVRILIKNTLNTYGPSIYEFEIYKK